MDKLDPESKIKLYELIISRYKDQINENEKLSISEIRQRISPYNDFIKSLKEKIIADLQPYSYDKHFFSAVQRAVDYIKGIRNVSMPVTFWLSFEEMDQLKAGEIMDQAILLASLLRSLDSKDVMIYVTRSGKILVGFAWADERYLVDPELGTQYQGEGSTAIFSSDPLAYAFNDVKFESFEEE